MNSSEILKKLTLEEKASLCSGKDFWHMKGIERLGLPEIMLTDGPHGLRKKNPDSNKSSLSDAVPATCFPTAATTVCSWDEDLLYRMGEAMGEECLQEKVSVILGPGVNIKRSPLCGRNFEYFSEDPYLAGKMAAALIKGIQSKGVGTSLKHFAVNSQEKRRMTIDSVVDERALRETYLTAFEIAVKEGKPWTVMNAYNRLCGTYCSDNEYLQTKILRDEWGFDGIVVTDWGAANDRVQGIKAGNDLEMPTSGGYNDAKICAAVRNGTLREEDLDKCVLRLIDLILKSKQSLQSYEYDVKAHHELACEVASQSLVLLKNEDNILPLKKDKTVAVIGEMARAPRYQGAGSSKINPTMLDDSFDALLEKGYTLNFAPGYNKKKTDLNEIMLKDAVGIAKRADTVVLFIGLTESYESEGYDREHLSIPESHIALLEEIYKVNENIVVVLSGGSPVEMPWLNKAKAVLNGYLAGQASGSAAANILSGDVCPSGKLGETYPHKLSDVPCDSYYPATGLTAEHRESVYIGYRYYDTAKKDVLFPFGYGLSYTSFAYSDLKLSKESLTDEEDLTLSFKIKNTGSCDGAEIAQVYVKDIESTVFRPEKELRAFKKVFLKKGEEKEVTLTLSKRAFAFYNINLSDWQVESGEFTVLVGASSRDIRLEKTVTVTSRETAVIPDYRETAPCYYTADVKDVPDKQFSALLGRPLPPAKLLPGTKLTLLNSLGDAKDTKWGKRICAAIDKAFAVADSGDGAMELMKAMVFDIPIRCFITMSSGAFNEKMAEGLLMVLNGEKTGKGALKIVSGLVQLAVKLPELSKLI
ncbi:MAG: glycoside hydrolase family 3 C-terminal domain-containing protein [Acutalibacteraceae bacterium]